MVHIWLQECLEKHIPISEDFNIIKVMGNPVLIREWNHKGLPTDTVSVENGILATKSSRWPLMIDTQQQANKWIKNLEKDIETMLVSDPRIGNMIKTTRNQRRDMSLQPGAFKTTAEQLALISQSQNSLTLPKINGNGSIATTSLTPARLPN